MQEKVWTEDGLAGMRVDVMESKECMHF
jgi:hypothetical protein